MDERRDNPIQNAGPESNDVTPTKMDVADEAAKQVAAIDAVNEKT
jgi:hypothetical protein